MEITFIDRAAKPRTAKIEECDPISIRMGMGYYYNGMPFVLDSFEKNLSYLHKVWYRERPEDWYIKNPVQEVISGPVLALHQPHLNNYSHFTLQGLGGYLFALKNGFISPQTKIIMDQSRKFQQELAALFNIPINQIIKLKNGVLYKFPQMIICSNLFYLNTPSDYVELYRNAAHNIGANKSISLYITRSPNKRRPCLNEQEIIDYLKQRNFEIADFEKISVAEQISLIKSAKIIVAEHGASGANLAYKSLEPFKFIELFGNRICFCHAALLKAKNCAYSATINECSKRSGTPKQDYPYTVDIGLLEKALEEDSCIFAYQPESESGYQHLRNLKDWQLPLFQPEYIKYVDAHEKFLQGNFAEVVNDYEKYGDNRAFKKHIHLYHKSLIFNGEVEKFISSIPTLMRSDVTTYWDSIADISSRLLDFSTLNKLLDICKQLNIKDAENHINNLLLKMKKLMDYSAFSWHFSPLPIDLSTCPASPNTDGANRNKIFLPLRALKFDVAECYRTYFKTNATNELADHLIVEFITPSYFTIKFNNSYLSAQSNGAYEFRKIAREWEYFFISGFSANSLI